MITYERLRSGGVLHDKIKRTIMSTGSPEEGNQTILDIVILGINKDIILLQFYDLVERLIDNPKLSKIMEVFKNGQCVRVVVQLPCL